MAILGQTLVGGLFTKYDDVLTIFLIIKTNYFLYYGGNRMVYLKEHNYSHTVYPEENYWEYLKKKS